jgi:hypothetical protein
MEWENHQLSNDIREKEEAQHLMADHLFPSRYQNLRWEAEQETASLDCNFVRNSGFPVLRIPIVQQNFKSGNGNSIHSLKGGFRPTETDHHVPFANASKHSEVRIAKQSTLNHVMKIFDLWQKKKKPATEALHFIS